jgi:aspartate--ammonia ligase
MLYSFKKLLKIVLFLLFEKFYSQIICNLIFNCYLCTQNFNNNMSQVIKPVDYQRLLDMRQTEQGIKLIKEFFQQNLSTELRLRRVTAPLFVLQGLGINDDLNGVERAVTFPIKDLGDARAEVVHSLAKWKRLTLAEYEVEPGYGIYTDMNAIRADEELDNLHSLYVDQWDWEAVIRREDRTLAFLKNIVARIYAAIRRTEYLVCESYPQIKPFLPETIHFVHAEELLQMYPDKTPKEREDAICKKYGAVFVIGIGGKLANGEKHDGRAPDYDDWSTVAEDGRKGLNGDILIWYPVLGRSFELSSMGIRVDKESLLRQLEIEGQQQREKLYFHQQLLNDKLPLSIGGGIGQSRLCMVLLHKAHIGEIQASIWPDEMRKECKDLGMPLI